MTEFTIAEISKIVNGELIGNKSAFHLPIAKIITDSRTFFSGKYAVFFALTGPRNNGHSYIPELIKKGVAAFVISNQAAICNDAVFILVENTTLALQKLAAHYRKQFNYPVIGITGSNGKTIVKEWLHRILGNKFQIVRSPKSYNSQIGVPLSILQMDFNYNLGIFEAGISKPGEMQKLQTIINPEIGILTNIGDAHQENFKSTQQKTEEKLLLFKSCKQLIFCVDSIPSSTIIDKFCEHNSIEKLSWTLKNNSARIKFSITKTDNSTKISATLNNQNYKFSIPFTDDSSIQNTCHCFTAVSVLSSSVTDFLPAFEQLETIEMRLEIKQGINHCLLVNDYYNSDLHSLSIALSVLHQQAAKEHLRKLIILSDIQQTGLPKDELYKKINSLLNEWKMDEIIGIGKEISTQAERFTMKKMFFESRTDFENYFNRGDFQSSAILIKGARQFEFEKISALLQQKVHQTQLEINLNALVENLNIFKSLLNHKTKVMAMVKAFSYGSGDVEIAKVLQYQNVDYLAVAVADEGVQLRISGIDTPIIVMNPEQSSFQYLIDYQLEPNIYSIELLRQFIKTTTQFGIKDFPVHLKIDTGMNRLGLKSDEEIQKVISEISASAQIKIKSVFSHLAASDDPALDNFTREQFQHFEKCYSLIENAFPYKIDRHILNSAGIERFPEKQFEMVRLGIGLYGISVTGLPLQTIGKLKSTISQIKKVMPDETVGYSRKGKVNKESEIAVIPLGYADGLDRKLGNGNGQVMIREKHAPIIGNICMDMFMVDVTGLKVHSGDSVEIFGPHISIVEVAEKAGTIPYEILTGISQRVKRVYLQE